MTTVTNPVQTLAEEHAQMVLLTSVLQKEQLLLNDGKVDSIPEVLTEKANIIVAITNLTGQRYALLAQLGYEDSEEGMQSWMKEHGNEDTTLAWEKLFEQARIAKELNRLNGMIINRHMSANQETLDAIQNLITGSNLYGPNGQSSLKGAGRQLGSA